MRLMTNSLQRLFSFGPAIDKIEWIFDEESLTIYREALNWWLEQKAAPPLYLSRRMGNHPILRNDKEVMPLQAADLIAWVTGKLTSPSPNPIAWEWAEQLSMPGTLDVWREENLAQFFERAKGRGASTLSYETGAQRSARLKELLGPRR
jgi:hypothetical protein